MRFEDVVKCYIVMQPSLTSHEVTIGEYFYKAGEAHATFAINNALADSANEAKKVERCETALTELYALWDSDQLGSKHVRAIIAKAQG